VGFLGVLGLGSDASRRTPLERVCRFVGESSATENVVFLFGGMVKESRT
jgi:hypothetical protein